MDKKKVLFVCLGNICRSPIAEGLLRDYAIKNMLNIEVDSAGTGNWHIGEAPHEKSIRVCKEHNVDISKLRARQIRPDEINYYDMVICFDKQNFVDITELSPKSDNIYKIGEFGLDDQDVPDPYFEDTKEAFLKAYEMIEQTIPEICKELKHI